MKIKEIDLFLYLYRIFWMFFSLKVVSKLTILGDYKRYATKNFFDVINNFYMTSGYFADLVFSFTRLMLKGNLILTNLLFCMLSTYSILFLLKRINYKKEILFLLLFPSFNIWSTYISKEVLYIILTGFFLGLYIDILENLKLSKKKKILFIFLFIGILIMKKQYIIFWLLMIEYLILKKFFRIKIKNINIFYVIQSILFILVLCILKNEIDIFFKNFSIHFDGGGSSRNLNYFNEKYGFFKHLFYGFYISIQGVSVSELVNGSIIKIISFIESIIILVYLCKKFLKNKIYYKFYFLLPVINILLIQYPFAIFNSGTAIRYRTNIYLILLFLPYIFKISKNKKRGNKK